jgi:peroxiredoxin
MKHLLIFVVSIFALASCGPEKNVRIKGRFTGANAEKIFLQELGREAASISDTMQLDANGNFSFKHKISQPTFYSLTVNNMAITLLAHPGEKMTISGDARHLPLTYSVEGSEESQKIRRLRQRLEHTVFVGDSLYKTLKAFEGNRNWVNIQRQMEWNYINEVDSLRAYNIRFMEENPRSLVVIYALYQQLSQNFFLFDQEDDIRYFPLFNRDEDIRYFRRADSVFYKRYPKVPYVNQLRANVITMNEQYNARKLNRMLWMLGQDAPEVALPTPDGKIARLSANKGKFVLLDFWASWSAPCRTENIALLDIYNKYRHQGFEVFQVSLDQSRSAWERAINEDGLTWINVCDFRSWESDAVKQYGVESLPANFLIDREGTIITKDLKGDALDRKLSEFIIRAQ